MISKDNSYVFQDLLPELKNPQRPYGQLLQDPKIKNPYHYLHVYAKVSSIVDLVAVFSDGSKMKALKG